jgi:hypothetical protein
LKKFGAAIAVGFLALVALVIGLVMHNQANFANSNVRSQLAEQGIVFQPVAALQPDQKAAHCLVANANKPLLTGAQAACYANYQIALDLTEIFGKTTYAELSAPARQAAYAAALMEAKDPQNPQLPQLEAAAAKAEAPADVAFQAQTLRGMLLTTYAFDHLGALGDTTADVTFLLAALLALVALGLAGMAVRSGGNVDLRDDPGTTDPEARDLLTAAHS